MGESILIDQKRTKEMNFIFRPENLFGLANGSLEQVVSHTGLPLSMIRDTVSGNIIGHAVGVVGEPFLAVPELVIGAAKMTQTQTEFEQTYRILKTLQNSLVVLQSTTTVIGLGNVVEVVLSAVNLQQTLQLIQEVKQRRVEVKDGFINMRKVLKDQSQEINRRLNQVSEDIKFEQHRLELMKAYVLFLEADLLIKSALFCENIAIKKASFAKANQVLGEALAIYNNPHLLSEICAAGKLRRLECAWIIQQIIALTFQLQNQWTAVSNCLSHLQDKIRTDCLEVIEECKFEEELDFLFPEITRILNHDLAVLESWQNHVEWIQTLSPEERKLLASSDMSVADSAESNEDLVVAQEPKEQLVYEDLKKKSHYLSLRDQLQFMINPDLRRSHESYLSKQATVSGYNALARSNWQLIPDLTLANLYWYFKDKEAQT